MGMAWHGYGMAWAWYVVIASFHPSASLSIIPLFYVRPFMPYLANQQMQTISTQEQPTKQWNNAIAFTHSAALVWWNVVVTRDGTHYLSCTQSVQTKIMLF